MFSASTFVCILEKRGKPTRMTATITTSNSGMVTARTTANCGLSRMDMISPPINMPGARRHMRIIILIMFMICVTSFVNRVTSEPVEK